MAVGAEQKDTENVDALIQYRVHTPPTIETSQCAEAAVGKIRIPMDRIFRAAAEIFMQSPALMKHLFQNFPDYTIDIEALRAAAREIFMNRLMNSITCLLSNNRQDPKSEGR